MTDPLSVCVRLCLCFSVCVCVCVSQQGVKQDPLQQWEVIPSEVCDVRQVKNSFKKLMKACVPSSVSADAALSFHHCLQDSEWMSLVGDHPVCV